MGNPGESQPLNFYLARGISKKKDNACFCQRRGKIAFGSSKCLTISTLGLPEGITNLGRIFPEESQTKIFGKGGGKKVG